MNCKICNDSMMSYFDDNLNDIETAQMKQHLKNCPDCCREFEAYSKVISLLKEDCEVELPHNFEANVMDKIYSFEVERKKITNRLLVFIYAVLTAIIAGVFFSSVALVKDLSAFELVNQAVQFFPSLSRVIATIENVLRITSGLISGLAEAYFQSSFIIIRSYYYAFIALLLMFLIIQKMFIGIVKQSGGTK